MRSPSRKRSPRKKQAEPLDNPPMYGSIVWTLGVFFRTATILEDVPMAKRGEGAKRDLAQVAGFTRPVRREARIDLRVTPEDLEEMKQVAESLGLTMSEYLRQCHKRAVEALRKGGSSG